MRSFHVLPSVCCQLALLAGLLLATGCTVPFGAAADPSALADTPPPTVTVELNPLAGKPRQISLLWQEGMTVQTVVEQSKAHRRYGEMELVLVRPPQPGSMQPQRMGAKWNRSKRQVSIDTDYAIAPGDLLIVNQVAQKTLADQMLGSLLGPMAK